MTATTTTTTTTMMTRTTTRHIASEFVDGRKQTHIFPFVACRRRPITAEVAVVAR